MHFESLLEVCFVKLMNEFSCQVIVEFQRSWLPQKCVDAKVSKSQNAAADGKLPNSVSRKCVGAVDSFWCNGRVFVLHIQSGESLDE